MPRRCWGKLGVCARQGLPLFTQSRADLIACKPLIQQPRHQQFEEGFLLWLQAHLSIGSAWSHTRVALAVHLDTKWRRRTTGGIYGIANGDRIKQRWCGVAGGP